MSRDWDESRWICGPAVAPKMFLRAASAVGNHHSTATSNISQPETTCVPPSIDCAKASKRLKLEKWKSAFDKEGRAVGFHKVLKAIVSGGVDHSIRPEVWEFLLGCYAIGTTSEHREQLRQARRLRYQELIEQCHAMHGSIGSGTLAYTVGTKIMDVRVTSKNADRVNRAETLSAVTRDELASWSAERFQDVETEETFEDSRENFEEGELDSAKQVSSAAADAASPLAASDEGSDSGPSEGEAENNNAEDNPDYLRLPVRTLFPNYVMGETDNKDGTSINTSEEDAEKTGEQKAENTTEVENERANSSPNGTEENRRANLSPNRSEFSEEKVADWLWTLHRIVVDVVRTDKHLKFYEDSRNMARMSDILAIYAWVDPATGYCQGMSDLLSPFILIYEDDADAFWCFESLLRRVRQNFQMDGPIGVMRQLQALTSILELTDVYVFKHFVRIGADSFLFAFRMLLVLFRRELSFGEALCMWEMMWAADFDHGISWALEDNCPELLIIKQPSPFGQDENTSEDNSYMEAGQKPTSPFFSFQFDASFSPEDTVGYHSRSPLCGLRAGNFWPRHSRHKLRTVSSILGKAGDDELSVFVVAAILILNRNRFMKDVHSMDDAIKAFNEIQMEIKVRSCIRTAIKLRRKYQRRLVKRTALERRATATQRPKQPATV